MKMMLICQDSKTDRIDTVWSKIADMKSHEGNYLYQNLAHIMLSLLCIFHCNAPCERVFSVVGKNMFCPSLSIKTLNSLLVRKIIMRATGKNCFTMECTDALLRQASSATYKHLQK